MVWLVWFSCYKTTNRIAPYGAVHCYLRCGAVIQFCGRFWCGFCDLVKTPSSNINLFNKVWSNGCHEEKFGMEYHSPQT